MKLTFFGGAKSVTGANYLLEHNGVRMLIDCGMFQGIEYVEQINYEDFPYDPVSIDYLFLTHGHIDHIGRVPKLVRDGFKGKIIATDATIDLGRLSLRDSARIIAQEARRFRRTPFFTIDDVEDCDHYFEKHHYEDVIELGPGMKVQLFSAGHVLGSTMYKFTLDGKIISFTGDIGNTPAPLIGPPDILGRTDYLVMESAYGDRSHAPAKIGAALLKEVIVETIKRGGTALIPSFALERTQILLYYINNMIENKEIPQIPIFVDSPLAIRITEVYKEYQHYFKTTVKDQIQSGDQIFDFPGLTLTDTVEQSKAINNAVGPKVIIAGNGMSTAGRILHHEKKYLSDPKNTVIIVGYQVKGSLGRALLDKQKIVKIYDKMVKNKADIHQISSFSAHADNPQLKTFVLENCEVTEKIFIVQGEENAAEQLAFELDELGYDAYAPNYRESFDL